MAAHGCLTNPCLVCNPSENIIVVPAEQFARLMSDDEEPTGCECDCHKPKHAARPPHPNTMAGR